MSVTITPRCVTNGKISRLRPLTSWISPTGFCHKLTRVSAIFCLYNTIRILKFSPVIHIPFSFVYLGHYIIPNIKADISTAERSRVFISVPNTAYIIGGISDIPSVVIILGRSRLSRASDTVFKGYRLCSTVIHYVFEHHAHNRRGLLGYYRLSFISVFKQNTAVAVGNLIIRTRLGVYSVIGKYRICRCYFSYGHSIIKLTEGKRRNVSIGYIRSVSIGTWLYHTFQSHTIIQKIKGIFNTEILKRLNGDGIYGLLYCVVYIRKTSVYAVWIGGPRRWIDDSALVGIGIINSKIHGYVIIYGCPIQQAIVHCGSVYRQGLYDRPGRTLCLCGIVLYSIGILLSYSPRNSKDVSVIGIYHYHWGLRCFGLALAEKIRGIRVIFLKNILNSRIHSCIYFKSSRVYEQICHSSAVSLLLYKIVYNILNYHIGIPGIYLTWIISRIDI